MCCISWIKGLSAPMHVHLKSFLWTEVGICAQCGGMELELRLSCIEKQLSNLHSLLEDTRKWQEILEPWLLKTFNMNMTKLMGRVKNRSYRRFLYRKSPRKATLPLSGLPSRICTKEKSEGSIAQDSEMNSERKNASSTSEPAQLRILTVNSVNKSRSSVDRTYDSDGSPNNNVTPHSHSSSHLRNSNSEVSTVSRSTSRAAEAELARTENFSHFSYETSATNELDMLEIGEHEDPLTDVKVECNLSISEDEDGVRGGNEEDSQCYDSQDPSSDNGFKLTQPSLYSQWVEENTDVSAGPRTRAEMPSHELGHRVGKLPLILNGTYFKVVATSDFGRRISAQCMKCKTAKIINGAARSSSNFLTHLKRLHKEDFQKFWSEKLKTTSPRIPVPENFYSSLNIPNSNQSATPLPTAPNPHYLSSFWPTHNYDSLQN